MSLSGPKFSPKELEIFQALAFAQSTDNSTKVKELVEQLAVNNIDKSRYNEYVAEIKRLEASIAESDALVAEHDVKVKYHETQIELLTKEANTVIAQHTPEYRKAVENAVNGNTPSTKSSQRYQQQEKEKS